jgi:hypothetical protein
LEFPIVVRAGLRTPMAVQIVMDPTGDTRHEFNVGDAEAVAKAERRFKQLTGVGLYGSGSHRRGAFEAHPQFRSRRRSRPSLSLEAFPKKSFTSQG